MPFQEVVEAEGHLIDSHIMENIFDKVVEYHGRFEVEQFRIGKTNSEPSYLRLKVETPDGVSLDRLLHELLEPGLRPGRIPAMRIWRRWSATAARRRISTPPPITRPTCAAGSSGSRWRTSAWTRMVVVRRRPRVLPPAARSARRATGSWWGCAASA